MDKRNHTWLGELVRVGLLLLSFGAHPAPVSLSPPTTQSQIENEQSKRLQEIEEAKRALNQLESVPELPSAVVDEQESCFQVTSIELEGNTAFTSEDILSWLDFAPSCLGLTRINAFLRIISNEYVKAGYVTSRAFLVPQDLSSGVLKLVVVEGKLQSLLFNGELQDFLQQAFPGYEGRLLNLRDIEQGLDQINRLRRYNAQIKMLPGNEQGMTVVDIQTGTGTFGTLGSGFNNGGQTSTGEEQVSVSLGGENLLGLLDKWSLTGNKSSEFVSSRDSDSLYFSVDLPYGYWNLGYSASYSTYDTSWASQGFTIDTNGKTNSHSAYLKWLFFRDSLGKSLVTLGVNHRRDKNYLMGSLIETSSRNLSSASLTLDVSRRLWGGYATLSPALVMGTDWFGGEKDSETVSVPSAQFYKGTITGSFTYPLLNSFSATSTVFSQWSNDTLYGSERLSIGGEYSVRGFKEVSISGDEGYYWRNDLTWQLGQLPYVGRVSAQWALDTGTIVRDKADAFERGSLAGTSVGLSTAARYFSSSLTAGFPLDAPSRLKADDYVLYYRLNLTY